MRYPEFDCEYFSEFGGADVYWQGDITDTAHPPFGGEATDASSGLTLPMLHRPCESPQTAGIS